MDDKEWMLNLVKDDIRQRVADGRVSDMIPAIEDWCDESGSYYDSAFADDMRLPRPDWFPEQWALLNDEEVAQ